jgi:hypothetical protein
MMARVTVHAVIHVAIYVRMAEVSGVVVAMARGAAEHRVI